MQKKSQRLSACIHLQLMYAFQYCGGLLGVLNIYLECFLPHECAHNYNTDVYEESGGK